MDHVVKVGRDGRITIPKQIREQCGIKVGDRLILEATENSIVLKPFPNLLDLVGVDAGYGTVEEVKKMVDKLREEY